MKYGPPCEKPRGPGVLEHAAAESELPLRDADGIHRTGKLGQQPPTDYSQFVGRGIEQRQVQPQLVFIGMKLGFERREGECFKPFLDPRGQSGYFLFSHRTQGAAEPLAGQSKRDSFQTPQFRRVQLSPSIPELFFRRVMLQEPGDFVDIAGARAATQQVPQQMQRSVCQRVGGVQGLPAAPFPELVDTGCAQPLGALVPELEMYFNRQRDFRIEVAPAAPLPAGFAD